MLERNSRVKKWELKEEGEEMGPSIGRPRRTGAPTWDFGALVCVFSYDFLLLDFESFLLVFIFVLGKAVVKTCFFGRDIDVKH